MDVIPAIDVLAGRVVVGPDRRALDVTAAALAARHAAAGAAWVHLADLDAAYGGPPGALDLVPDLVALRLRVQVSGLRDGGQVAAALARGASRVVLAASALADRAAVGRLAAEHGERLAVSLDVRGDRVDARGGGGPDESLSEALAWLEPAGVARYVVASVAREGTGAGPDLELLGEVRSRTRRPVIASGGVANGDDVIAVRDAGAEAVIVGSALSGGFDLAAALAAARGATRG